MKDFLENEICVGDRIAYFDYSKNNMKLYFSVVKKVAGEDIYIKYGFFGLKTLKVSPSEIIVYRMLED